MDRSLAQITETLVAARAVSALLRDRLSASRSISDLDDLSVIQTTVRMIERLLDTSAEYDDILRRQLQRTNARLRSSSL